MPLLQITVALGTRWKNRSELLLKVTGSAFPHADLEHLVQDEQGRWSYTFTVEASVEKVCTTLKKNGRFKIIRILDLSHNKEISVPRPMRVRGNTWGGCGKKSRGTYCHTHLFCFYIKNRNEFCYPYTEYVLITDKLNCSFRGCATALRHTRTYTSISCAADNSSLDQRNKQGTSDVWPLPLANVCWARGAPVRESTP